jgi:hypothetical protein
LIYKFIRLMLVINKNFNKIVYFNDVNKIILNRFYTFIVVFVMVSENKDAYKKRFITQQDFYLSFRPQYME